MIAAIYTCRAVLPARLRRASVPTLTQQTRMRRGQPTPRTTIKPPVAGRLPDFVAHSLLHPHPQAALGEPLPRVNDHSSFSPRGSTVSKRHT
jgi:hypothetical protein